jgi:hypothetical protein
MPFRWLSALLLSIGVAGCAGTETVESWEGRPLDSLIFAWGPPLQDAELSDGRRVVLYGRVIGGPTDCTAIFRADRRGVITNANTEGTPDGCDQLQSTKPAAR